MTTETMTVIHRLKILKGLIEQGNVDFAKTLIEADIETLERQMERYEEAMADEDV